MTVYTIGFTKKSASRFFGALRASGASSLIDVRLHNVSQLAGFAKRDDLEFFLREVAAMDYKHEPAFAPTAPLLDDYRGRRIDWAHYEKAFLELLAARQAELALPREALEGSVLLCSEDSPERCHRRLVAEYLRKFWPDLEIKHLR